MKLLPLEMSALVAQEIRRIRAAAARMSEANESLLMRRAQWKIENAMRALDAGESLPTALGLFQKYWEQLPSRASASSVTT
jgi:transcriptional regulator